MLKSIFLVIISSSLSVAAVAQVEDFDSIKLYTLKNESGMTVKVTNFGAIIASMFVPDRDGKAADVVLGYNKVEDYINAVDKPYFGSVVGRYGNRIANGEFELEGKSYSLLQNNGKNHLHGGAVGFDKVVWDVDSYEESRSLKLSYHAKDMEEGYPGNLLITVCYTIQDTNTLTVEYHATTDKATPVNLTQHTYFNLEGEGAGNILNHELMLNASHITPVDAGLIPTGDFLKVEGTPFDFRKPQSIGNHINDDHTQIKYGGGYDHNWVLAKDNTSKQLVLAAQVSEPNTGRILTVHTTEPGIQFYSGNFLDGRLKGKSGRTYKHRYGFCLETQHFPDSPNQPNFPSTILVPGKVYSSKTTFSFTTK